MIEQLLTAVIAHMETLDIHRRLKNPYSASQRDFDTEMDLKSHMHPAADVSLTRHLGAISRALNYLRSRRELFSAVSDAVATSCKTLISSTRKT